MGVRSVYRSRDYLNSHVPAYGPCCTWKLLRSLERINKSVGTVVDAECLPPRPSPSLAQELLMSIPWRTVMQEGVARVLIDTGCRVALLVRSGLISKWKDASRPLSFTTASGAPMPGGLRGAMFHLTLSVQGEHGPFPARLTPVWGYEAALEGPDMIVGYPLLSLFGLMIDARANCLRLGDGSTTIFKDPPPPPTVEKLSDSSGLSFFSVSVDRKAPQALAVAARLGDPAGRELPSGPTTAGDTPSSQILRQRQTLPPPAQSPLFHLQPKLNRCCSPVSARKNSPPP